MGGVSETGMPASQRAACSLPIKNRLVNSSLLPGEEHQIEGLFVFLRGHDLQSELGPCPCSCSSLFLRL